MLKGASTVLSGGKFRDYFKELPITIDKHQNYDLIKIIGLNFGKETTSHKLLNLLHLLFMDRKKTDEKEKILRDEYKIKLTRDMREEVVEMGGLMKPLLEIAAETKKIRWWKIFAI